MLSPKLRRTWLPLATAVIVASTLGVPGGSAQATPRAAVTGTAVAATEEQPVEDPIAHDPSMVKEGEWYYTVITGDFGQPETFLPMKRSKDLIHWEELGPVFTAPPAWLVEALGVTPRDLWAPDLNRVNGQWYLYYAGSEFGTNNSVIGLATTKTLDPDSPDFGWVDRGLVLQSGGDDDFNAIDPEFVRDAEGRSWLAWGSFWGGIKIRRLDPTTGKFSSANPEIHTIASRLNGPNAIEGPSITRHGGYYYLFISFDYCCRGLNSDYRVMVGRSRSITGPYVDRNGVDMTQGGGTELLRGYNEFFGTGHGDIYREGSTYWFAHHYYDADSEGAPRLSVRKVIWRGGWPRLSDPVNPSRMIGHGDAFVKIVNRAHGEVLENTGCGYEASPIRLAVNRANVCQEWQLNDRGDNVSILNRFSNQVAEVAACGDTEGAQVAHWGWVGQFGDANCQRWTFQTTADGYINLHSVFAPQRVMTAEDCVQTRGSNVVVRTASGSVCQDFRFKPVGKVLIADPERERALDVVGCRGDEQGGPGVRFEKRRSDHCQEWTFQHLTGPNYAVVNAKTGMHLTPANCSTAGTGLRVRAADQAGRACRGWSLLPTTQGWTLTNDRNGQTLNIQLLRP